VQISLARLRPAALGLATALTLAAPVPAHASRGGAGPVCGPVLAGFAHCDALVARRPRRGARAATGPFGYGPAQLQDAYGLTSVAAAYGADQTVAIVDAYDLPTAEATLATYRAQYGLPPCTSAGGCFRKVDQNGGTTYPAYNSGWAGEIALDIEAVSAICPHCHILLVEAATSNFSDLGAAVNRAAALGATQISNSYGNAEFSHETSLESYFDHPGVAITVSSGDNGYGVEYPAASQHVTAVGGTSLTAAASARGWSETAWAGSGSGCSQYIAKPAWQTDLPCARRSVADVSAVADPATGLAIYSGGVWGVYGGTSASAPIVAAAYALTGSSAAGGSFPYDHSGWFNDVTSGANAASCTFNYLCIAGVGFDGPTGMGTPNSAHPSGPPPVGGDSGTPVAEPPLTAQPSPPTPPPPPVSSAPVRSSLSVSSSGVTASRSGRLLVRLTCGAAAACNGRVTLLLPLKGGKRLALAKGSYRLGAGTSARATVRLSRHGLRLVRTKRRLRVYATALDSDGTAAQSSFVLRRPR
jgi:hypothetical protein